MNDIVITEADMVTAGLIAYNRGWHDCLEAMIPMVGLLDRADAIKVMTRLRDKPPPEETK